MSAAASTTRVDAGQLSAICEQALIRSGADFDAARIQAAQLLEGELRGHPSHGLLRLKTLCARLDAGLISASAAPEFLWSAPGALRVDGRNGFGPVIANQVLDLLIPRALDAGIAVAAIRRSHHLGILAPYVERIAAAGCVGIILTSSEALVHPWGGARALVGTNPIGIGIPARDGSISLDMSTGAVSAGKILDHAARGRQIPSGWAVDSDGHPTTDAGAAAAGAISPFGGAKGYALGIAFESLVGLLSGTAFGADVHGTLDAEHPVTKGDLIIVMSAGAFGARADDDELARYLSIVRASGIDGQRVSVPGDRSRLERDRRLREGIDVDATTWAHAQDLAGSEKT